MGDGDSKTFKGILSVNPYGDENIVEKKNVLATLKNEWDQGSGMLKKITKALEAKAEENSQIKLSGS